MNVYTYNLHVQCAEIETPFFLAKQKKRPLELTSERLKGSKNREGKAQ